MSNGDAKRDDKPQREKVTRWTGYGVHANEHGGFVAYGDYLELERELADANYWRKRWADEAEARGKQSQEHWQKWKDAERALVTRSAERPCEEAVSAAIYLVNSYQKYLDTKHPQSEPVKTYAEVVAEEIIRLDTLADKGPASAREGRVGSSADGHGEARCDPGAVPSTGVVKSGSTPDRAAVSPERTAAPDASRPLDAGTSTVAPVAASSFCRACDGVEDAAHEGPHAMPSSVAPREPVAWCYTNKKTGVETLTRQPPDRTLFVDDYDVAPLYSEALQSWFPSATAARKDGQ